MKPYKDLSKIIHREGYIFVLIFAVVTFILGAANDHVLWIGIIATLWCAYFFRNPDRVTPDGVDLVVSPADGIVQSIKVVTPPEEVGLGEEEMLRVSIFLNIFNVHINRVPASGKILKMHYYPGKFFNASLDKASIYNERQSVLMETVGGIKVAFVQIAGLIARRIVCDLEEGSEIKVGEKYGLIRFGSRVDVYLPKDTMVNIAEGQTCIGGETIIANFSLKQKEKPVFVERNG